MTKQAETRTDFGHVTQTFHVKLLFFHMHNEQKRAFPPDVLTSAKNQGGSITPEILRNNQTIIEKKGYYDCVIFVEESGNLDELSCVHPWRKRGVHVIGSSSTYMSTE